VLKETRKPLVSLYGFNRLFQGLSHAAKLLAPGRKTKPQLEMKNTNLTAPANRDEFTQE
jgi:hypothetical protein